MSKQWFAFFKRAIACVAVSAFFALPTSAAEKSGAKVLPSLPTVSFAFSQKADRPTRVGDAISYSLQGGDPHWQIDPKVGSLKEGFLFRPGKLFIPLVAGKYQVPALPVVDESGTVVAMTDPTEIEAKSNLKDTDGKGEPPKPEPALGPLGLPFPLWIQSAVGFTLLGVVLVAGFFLIRAIKRRAAKALKAMLPKKPYDVAALDRLDGLLKQGMLEKGQFKPFAFGISETLKFYLAERFQFDAQESTTSELMALLRERSGTPGLNESVIRRIDTLFNVLDPIKFANIVPSADEARSLLKDARDLVTSTRKVAAVAPASAERRVSS